ncbi:MAG: hypothetical protein Q8M06_03795 [Methanobacteriaceae archaeon]|nr:hypothetical protein [Methanobacteriaceae archaeon]
MNINDIITNVNEGKSVIMYKQDIKAIIPELASRWTVIYVAEPNPPKLRLAEILTKLGAGNKETMKRFTIEELKEKIAQQTRNKKVIIALNNFEKITKTSVEVFEFLMSLPGIILLCSYKKKFKPHAYKLFIAMESYVEEKDEEIRITYALFLIIAGIFVLIYLKIAFAIDGFMAFLVLAALWFGLTIFRTLLFVAR